MSNRRVLILGLVAMEFMGKYPIAFKGKPHRKLWRTVNPRDVLILEEYVALAYCKGDDWKEVKMEDVDVLPYLLQSVTPQELIGIANINVGNVNQFSTDELVKWGIDNKVPMVADLGEMVSREKVLSLVGHYLPQIPV